jgi:hypothetical protein
MSLEDRIIRIEDAIKNAIEHRDWLKSHEWHEHRQEDPDLAQHIDDAIDQNEQNIETYRNILSTLRAR